MSTVASPRVLSPDSMGSSYDYISARSNSGFTTRSPSYGVLSDDAVSDADEIVWSVSDLSLSAMSITGALSHMRSRSPGAFSDEDYIVLSRARSPAQFNAVAGSSSSVSPDVTRAIERELTAAISALSLTQTTPKSSSVPIGPTRFDIRRALNISADTSPATTLPSSKKAKKRAAAAEHTVGNASRAAANLKAARKAEKKAEKKERKKEEKARAQALQQSSPAPATASAPSSPVQKKDKAKPKKAFTSLTPPQTVTSGLGERAIVDDVSEIGDTAVDAVTYHDAVAYISSFLSNPTAKSGSANLKLLQALIIELGLCPSALLPSPSSSAPFPSLPSLPHSMRAAKALLKSSVFLNVRDYLAVRGQGLEALRRVMHPSRGSLMREVRSGRRMPLKTIKDAGLNVLLVTCF